MLGLNGELIPMAIPVKLPQQRSADHIRHHYEPSQPQREPSPLPQTSDSLSEHRSPPRMQQPPTSLVSY